MIAKDNTINKSDILLIFIINSILALLLYSRILKAFYIFDDISIITITSPYLGKGWIDCFLIMDNGFWRPLILASARLMLIIFGYNPLSFHLTVLFFHIVCGALTALVCSKLGMSKYLCYLSSVLLISHFGAFPVVSHFQNIGDVYLAISLLVGIIFFENWRKKEQGASGILIMCLLAFMAKESGVVFPLIILIWAICCRSISKKFWLLFVIISVLSFIFFSMTILNQFMIQRSYIGEGSITFSLKNFVRQLCDYVFSVFFPFIHTLVFPFHPLVLPHFVLWIIRFCVIIILFFILINLFLKKNNSIMNSLFIIICVIIAPTALFQGNPQGRYLYPALPFAVIVICQLLISFNGLKAILIKIIIAILWIVFLLSFFLSPSVDEYKKVTSDVGTFVSEIKKISPAWSDGNQIAIYNHPHPGIAPWRWSYCQQIFNIFIPDKKVTIALDTITSDTSHIYRFENNRLINIENAEKIR